MKKIRFTIIVIVLNFLIMGFIMSDQNKIDKNNENFEKATFAGGCFWCMQPPYDDLPGVISTTVGYIGGHTKNPTYEEVCSGETGHAEAVQIVFNPKKTSYAELLQAFWRNIDPTNAYGQFADVGSQYRTAIFYYNDKQKEVALRSKKELEETGKYNKPIVTEIVEATTYYPAEEHHQKFYKKNPLRYNSYKVGSGRAGYIKEKWGKK